MPFRRKPLTPRTVLVRLPNWVGDIVMALPALQALRAHDHGTRLVAMARPDHLEFVRRISVFDEVLPGPSKDVDERWGSWWKVVRTIWTSNFQVAILLAPSFESALTAFLGGVPIRVGHIADRRSWLLSHRVAVNADKHRKDEYLDVVKLLGAEPVSGPVPLRFQLAERRYVDQFFKREGFDQNARPVFVNPAAAKTPRAWSSERFRQLAEYIADKHQVQVLVHQHPPFRAPTAWPRHPQVRVIEDATLVQLGAVIQRCRLYVGNDSGPMHVAAALGIPTVGIYGSSSPGRTSPSGDSNTSHLAVSSYFSCSPCRERFFEDCPSPPSREGRPPCLDEINVDTVAEQVDRLLMQN